MKVTPAAAVIALLVASNVFTAYLAIGRRADIHADHLQRIHLNTEGDGTIFVTLGTSDTPSGPVANNPRHAATLALTPRAAIQMQVEFTRVIEMVQGAADRGEAQRSPDRPL